MKLVNFLDVENFNRLRETIGAPLSSFRRSFALPKAERRPPQPSSIKLPLPTEGLDVKISDIKGSPDGTLVFNDERVIVHIRDAASFEPRFHIAHCEMLIQMRSMGKFDRYVVSPGTDSYFYIRISSGPLAKRRLDVCQYCLGHLKWKGFSRDTMTKAERTLSVRQFSIPEFFSAYPKSLHPVKPQYTVDSAPVNEYPSNWEDISLALRAQLWYICQGCNLDVGEVNKRYLHVHHISSNKFDCRPENLRCLCIRCHADQPGHGQLRSLPEFKQFELLFPKPN